MAGDAMLREVVPSDLSIFFEQQLDSDANWMAAFAASDPANRGARTANIPTPATPWMKN